MLPRQIVLPVSEDMNCGINHKQRRRKRTYRSSPKICRLPGGAQQPPPGNNRLRARTATPRWSLLDALPGALRTAGRESIHHARRSDSPHSTARSVHRLSAAWPARVALPPKGRSEWVFSYWAWCVLMIMLRCCRCGWFKLLQKL